MKKSFLILAAAACVALCNISCGSDDDGGSSSGNTPVKLPQPTYSDLAADFAIPVDAVTDKEACLTGLNFTESGKAIVEVATNGTKKYVTYNYNAKTGGDTYVITDKNGKKVGEVKTAQAQAPTRSSTDITVTFEIEVYIPGLGTYVFKTDGTTARKTVETVASTNTVNLARTWKVQEMKLTLEGDVSASINEKSGNLRVLAEEAQARGADLTADEMAEMNKTVKGMTLDKNGLFSIEYDDVTEACSWAWTDANQTKLQIKLRDSEFGNRFLCENSVVNVKFFDGGVCHFTLTTDITTKSKKYKATLLVVMQS